MDVPNILLYVFLFIAMYAEVFLLVTFLEGKERIKTDSTADCTNLASYPSVTIIIPCWNEEKTIKGTVESLLALDYPADRLTIMAIDDGSTDGTWQALQEYKDCPRVSIHTKENGGKYTALNYAIARTESDLVGCLDADSFVDPMTLRKIVRVFENKDVMAVTPAIRIWKPTTVIQHIQYLEYSLGILLKKLFGLINAIHVTPGPFSIFRREVFDKIGLFRHAHNTEDMEIAMRMHTNHMKIENSHTAWVYTVGPRTFKALYKQRVRWTHGFIENAMDYKHLFFNKKYGNLGTFTMPATALSIIGFLTLLALSVFNVIMRLNEKFLEYKTVGFVWKMPSFHFNWFYLNTGAAVFISIFLFSITFSLIVIAKLTVDGKFKVSKDVVLYFLLYPIIAPLWILSSVFNAVFARKPSWR